MRRATFERIGGLSLLMLTGITALSRDSDVRDEVIASNQASARETRLYLSGIFQPGLEAYLLNADPSEQVEMRTPDDLVGDDDFKVPDPCEVPFAHSLGYKQALVQSFGHLSDQYRTLVDLALDMHCVPLVKDGKLKFRPPMNCGGVSLGSDDLNEVPDVAVVGCEKIRIANSLSNLSNEYDWPQIDSQAVRLRIASGCEVVGVLEDGEYFSDSGRTVFFQPMAPMDNCEVLLDSSIELEIGFWLDPKEVEAMSPELQEVYKLAQSNDFDQVFGLLDADFLKQELENIFKDFHFPEVEKSRTVYADMIGKYDQFYNDPKNLKAFCNLLNSDIDIKLDHRLYIESKPIFKMLVYVLEAKLDEWENVDSDSIGFNCE